MSLHQCWASLVTGYETTNWKVFSHYWSSISCREPGLANSNTHINKPEHACLNCSMVLWIQCRTSAQSVLKECDILSFLCNCMYFKRLSLKLHFTIPFRDTLFHITAIALFFNDANILWCPHMTSIDCGVIPWQQCNLSGIFNGIKHMRMLRVFLLRQIASDTIFS